MTSDEQSAVTPEPESAQHLRAAAALLDEAQSEMSDAIEGSDMGTTAGVAAGYRAEASGLASRLRQYADVIDADE